MNNSHSDAYAAAGVDITAGYEGVRLMKPFVERTKSRGSSPDSAASAASSPRTSRA